MFNWIELNEDGYVKGVYFNAENPPETGVFVKAEDDPYAYFNKQYVNDKWIDVEQPTSDPEPTEVELAQAEMLLMQSEIIANQNAQDEVLAEILLNQVEGVTENV